MFTTVAAYGLLSSLRTSYPETASAAPLLYANCNTYFLVMLLFAYYLNWLHCKLEGGREQCRISATGCSLQKEGRLVVKQLRKTTEKFQPLAVTFQHTIQRTVWWKRQLIPNRTKWNLGGQTD